MNGLNLRPYLTLFLTAAGCMTAEDVATEATGSLDGYGETGTEAPEPEEDAEVTDESADAVFDAVPHPSAIPSYEGVTPEEFASVRAELYCRAHAWCVGGGCPVDECSFEGSSCREFQPDVAATCLTISHEWTLAVERGDVGEGPCLWATEPAVCTGVFDGNTCGTGDGGGDGTIPEDEGRPIREHGTALLPILEATMGELDAAHQAAAEVWLRAAQAEHGSIAAFARLSQELLALGAPPQLVAQCHRAALDEIGHAQACLDTAKRLGAEAEIGIQPQPNPRTATLRDLVVESLVEGCYGEAVAAIRAETAAAHARPDIAETLLEIAEDETRHAALAWSVVDWALGEDPRLAGVVRAAMDELRTKVESRGFPAERGMDLRVFGVATSAQRRAIAKAALEGLVEPTLARLLQKHA